MSDQRVLVTGGAGFIGSHFVELLRRERPEWHIVVLDKLTYAGRRDNLPPDPAVELVVGDVCQPEVVDQAMRGCSLVFNFAAESHVDRSLLGGAAGGAFVQTDVYGVWVLLDAARRLGIRRFLQVSTDEVYGEVLEGRSRETDCVQPRSPYAASKAAAELLVGAMVVSHGLDAVITRGSNTFGPRQYPEKLLPLFVTNAIDDLPLPMYGDGRQMRDWLWVGDHCRGILQVAEHGLAGEAYNLGGNNERTNRWMTEYILKTLGKPAELIQRVSDRPGHDRRYALCSDKAVALGWQPDSEFEVRLRETIHWYQNHESWWRPVKTGADFQKFHQQAYEQRSG